MPSITKPSTGVLLGGIVLAGIILLAWVALLGGLTELDASDAAGNGMSQAFSALNIAVVWLLLAALALVAALGGAMPLVPALAALILIPVSGYAAFVALELLSHPGLPPFYWPMIAPAVAPPAIVLFCLWALLPPLRRAVPAWLAGGAAWGVVLAVSVAMMPLSNQRGAYREQQAATAAKSHAALAALPANAPLWDWTPFLGANYSASDKALDAIRHLDRRQADAETMLARGDFPLGYLSQMDLDPTPSLCDKARAELRRQVAPLILATPQSRPYADIALKVNAAVSAMTWLVGYDCAVDAESMAWETMAQAYRGTDYDVHRLAELRDPKELGRVLRESPAKFSMLTPRAHLKAWLSFAGDQEYRERAIAGARRLDHRTADAIEMLDDRSGAPGVWQLVAYLPELDLDATPQLCASALRVIDAEFQRTYRPKPNDPRQYRELVSRLGRGDPLVALQWLAGHGCDADAELADADALIRSYQDSPARADMLAKLARLRRKPAN